MELNDGLTERSLFPPFSGFLSRILYLVYQYYNRLIIYIKNKKIDVNVIIFIFEKDKKGLIKVFLGVGSCPKNNTFKKKNQSNTFFFKCII